MAKQPTGPGDVWRMRVAAMAVIKGQAFVAALADQRAVAANVRGASTPNQEERLRHVAQWLGLDKPARLRKGA